MCKKKNKIFVTLLSLLIALIFIITMFLSIQLNTYALGEREGNLNYQYANAMSSIKNITKANPNYLRIAMLGSHDSTTYTIEPNANLDKPEYNRITGKLYPISKGIQYRYAVTQNCTLYDQLMQGSRFIQIKLSTYQNELYTTHCSLGDKVENSLIDVIKYLDYCEQNNYGEIVTLVFRPVHFDQNMYLSAIKNLIEKVSYKNKTLLDYANYEPITINESENSFANKKYNDLTNNGSRPCVVLTCEPYWLEEKNCDYDNINTPNNKLMSFSPLVNYIEWYNHTNQKLLFEAITNDVKNILENKSKFPVDQNLMSICQFSPSFSTNTMQDVLSIINNWSLLKMAEQNNPYLVSNKENLFKLLDVYNVLQLDYVNSNNKDFNNKINVLIKEYNEKMMLELIAKKDKN